MTINGSKARVLFEFRAEGPSELNLTAGEIITITSGSDGNDWWYAKNSSGESGAIPASYIKILDEQSNSNQPTTNDETTEINVQSQVEEETSQAPSIQSPENGFTSDSSFDSVLIRNNNTIEASTANSFDPYKTILDPSSSKQHNSLLGDLVLSPPIADANATYDTSSSRLVSSATNETFPVDSAINDANADDSNGNKSKPEKSKLFTLKRQKLKTDPEKRRSSVDNSLDSSFTIVRGDSDSDGLSDSGSSANTLSTSNKHSTGGGDSKTLSRARFFDKHAVGNYLLNEWKSRTDEHVEIAYDENEGGVCWIPNPSIPPFTCKIENPSKEKKFSGLKSFVEYEIHPQIPGNRFVRRRYKQFDWLHDQLGIKYRFICIPPLPGKQVAGRFDQEFIEERRRQLELWVNRICRHPVLCASFPVQHFITCELTEKNNKDWKAGKRKIEKDELRESSWLHCVTSGNTKLSETEITTQIDRFAQQQPALEMHLKNLNQSFSKYLERHTEVQEHDIQRVGELFSKLHGIAGTDATTPGNDELTDSMSKISTSYNGIAQLYRTKGSVGIRDFVEHVQDYLGLLSAFPIIINIQRSAMEFIRNNKQRNAPSTSDSLGVIHRSEVLNRVVLAEINFFQKTKVTDLRSYMKGLLTEQIEFYDKITMELRDGLSTLD